MIGYQGKRGWERVRVEARAMVHAFPCVNE
jgi:hypothetical protein